MARIADREKYRNKRETFLQLFNRSCERVFGYCFELCLNHNDASLLCREAFINMYYEISTLRSAPNVDYWQRKIVDKTIRHMVRQNKLELIHEKTQLDAPDTINSEEKEDIWRRINRTVDLDPWRLVPEPGKSTIFSVLADQAVSDIRYMEPVDIAKSAGIIFFIIVLFFGSIFGGFYLLSKRGSKNVDPMEQIFLDERRYAEYSESYTQQISQEEINSVIKEAFGGLDDEAGISKGASISNNTAGSPIYTNSPALNTQLKSISDKIITKDMSDTERLWAIYNYVGKNIRYVDVSDKSEEPEVLLDYYFKTQTGDSRHYAALFKALCNISGYSCDMVKGRFILNGDTEFRRDIRHYWNKMTLNGMYYFFDCEADSDELGTEVREYYFMAAEGNNKWSFWNRDHKEN